MPSNATPRFWAWDDHTVGEPPFLLMSRHACTELGGVPMEQMALGFARLNALIGLCAHASAVPVDLLLTGERVAWICPECDTQLPAGWG